MKNNPIYISTILIVSLLFFSACEKPISGVKLPHIPERLVITSFISPQDTMIRVKVFHSFPLGKTRSNDDNGEVLNATVLLSNDIKEVSLLYDINELSYVIDTDLFPVEAGKTYYLKVSTPDGKKVSANCTVPLFKNESQDIAEVINSGIPPNNVSMNEYKIKINFKDIAGEKNTYRVYGFYEVDNSGSQFDNEIIFKDNIYINDQGLDGNLFTIRGSFFKPENTEARITLQLINSDMPYYLYHTSLQKYNSDDNPFSEPTLIYVNIEGGLGIFCAYNSSFKEFVVNE